jgi:hypothetical protein
MQNIAATPSGIGYTIGYDVDGILKQKDQNGVITPVGLQSFNNLEKTLSYGINSGSYSILMGTSSRIGSSNIYSTGNIKFDYGMTNSVMVSVTASNIESSLLLSQDSTLLKNSTGNGLSYISLTSQTFSNYAGTSTYSTSIIQDGVNFNIQYSDTTIGTEGVINALEIVKTYDIGSENKVGVHINSKNAHTNNGVKNSVVIGGQSLTASVDNTVYLGNNVNINNKYTLPNSDGLTNQVLITNGSGTVSWATPSNSLTLKQVLETGNDTEGNSIIIGTSSSIQMGSQSTITSSVNTNQIDLSTDSGILLSTDNGVKTGPYVQISQSGITMSSNSIYITTTDSKGMQYGGDYSNTFTDNSLVSKKYVDSSIITVNTYQTAYVDINYGSDANALLNRFDKPFKTVASASSVISASYSSGLIHIKRGTYEEPVYLQNNFDYYCEPGTVFSKHGFRDNNISVKSNIYGYASFIGTDTTLTPLFINNTSSEVNMEFDKIDTTNRILQVHGGSASLKGNYMKTVADAGYGINVQDGANVNIYVRDGILSAYNTLLVNNSFSGRLYIDTTYIKCNGDIGSSGVQSDLQHVLKVDYGTTGTIIINSNLENISSTFGSGNNSAVYIKSGKVTVNGNITGGESPAIYLDDNDTFGGEVVINGNIISKRENIINNNGYINLTVKNSLIKTNGEGVTPYSVYLNADNSKLYVVNSTIYNSLTDSDIIYVGYTSSVVGFYNTLAYSNGTSGSFINVGNTFSLGMHNVRSNKDNDPDLVVDLFNPSGFIYDPNLYIPNI